MFKVFLRIFSVFISIAISLSLLSCRNGGTLEISETESDESVSENKITQEEFVTKMAKSIYTEKIDCSENIGLYSPSDVGIERDELETVLYPVPSDSEFAKIYDASGYGILPNNSGEENSDALDSLLKLLKEENGLKKVMLPSGEYKFNRTLSIEGINDVYFCGDFHILMTDWVRGINVSNCKNIHFNNCSFDYEVPSAVTGEVLSCDMELRQVVIKIDSDFDLTNPKYNGGKVEWGSYMEFFFDDYTGKYVPDIEGNLLYNSTGDGIKNMENGVYNAEACELTLTFREGSLREVKKGVKVNIAYTMYEYFGFYAHNCEDVYIESVSFYHTLGMAIGMGYTKNIYLNRFKLSPKEGMLMTATADGFHPGSCTGKIVVTNSVFEYSHDDSMNIKGAYSSVSSFNNKEFALDGSKADIRLEKGDVVDLYEVAAFKHIGTYTVKAWNPKTNVCTVEEDISKEIDYKGALICNATKSPSLTIKNTFFGNKRNRGMLIQCREVEVSNCTFQNILHGSIQILSVADIFAEGIMPKNVVVKNNKFINNTTTDVDVFTWGPNGTTRGTITGIKVENNLFYGTKSVPVHMLGAGDSSVTNNLFLDLPVGIKKAVNLDLSENITVNNNRLLSSSSFS